MDADLDVLKQKPLQHQLRVFFHGDPPVSLQLVNYLLSYTIPETYNDLPSELQAAIVGKLQNLVGLGNLLNSIRNTSNGDWVLLYGRVLENVLDDSLICKLVVGEKDPQRLRLVDKLLFKGETLGVINEFLESIVKLNSVTYGAYLSDGIIRLCQNKVPYKTICLYMISTLGVTESSSTQFFDTIFCEATIEYFWSLVRQLRLFETKSVWRKLLWQYFPFRFTLESNQRIIALSRILLAYGDFGFLDVDFVERNLGIGGIATNKLIAYLIPSANVSAFAIKLLSRSCDKNALKSKPITIQVLETHLVLQLLIRSKTSDETKSLLKNPVFLTAISNRLESLSSNVKILGIILAEKLCKITGEESIFKFDDLGEYRYLLENDTYILLEEFDIEDSQSDWQLLLAPRIIENEDDEEAGILTNTHDTQIQNIAQMQIDDDSDMESDNEGDPSRTKPSKPLYIKDLLNYLTVDTNNKQAYDKRRLALTLGPTLIRQKARFGNEVAFLADSLYTTLISLDNVFMDDDFYDWILQNLVAVIASHYTTSLHVCRLLLNGDYSLQQRVMILTSLTLAARELKGLADDLITKSYSQNHFPTKQLPPNVHHLFGIIDGLESKVQDTLMLEASQDAQEQIDELNGVGKVLRISNKLKKRTSLELDTPLKPLIDNFYKVIGRYFFFPLCNVWYESGGIDIGLYSSILRAHFIKTLSLLLHCSYPSATDLHSMCREYLLITTSSLKQVDVDELQLIESIATGVLIVCEVCDENYLVTEFYNELTEVHTWLANIWELLIDNKVKSVCAGVLLRISSLFEKHNRLIENQLNSMY